MVIEGAVVFVLGNFGTHMMAMGAQLGAMRRV